jgi:hypothetical protein
MGPPQLKRQPLDGCSFRTTSEGKMVAALWVIAVLLFLILTVLLSPDKPLPVETTSTARLEELLESLDDRLEEIEKNTAAIADNTAKPPRYDAEHL